MAWLSLWDKMLKDYFSLSSALVIDWNFFWRSFARGSDRNAGYNKTGASSLQKSDVDVLEVAVIRSPCHL